MRSGLLREEIVIEEWVESSRGSMGSSQGAWQTHAAVWAEVVQLRGDEALRLATQNATATYRIRIRRLTSVTTAMRATWGAKALTFSAIEDRRAEGLTVILASERVTP